MAFFGMGKKRDVVDLGEFYRKHQDRVERMKEDVKESQTAPSPENASGLPMFNFDQPRVETYSENLQENHSPEERRKKLAKRLIDMTNKIDDLTSQVYHLQQRVEVLEKKNKTEFLN